MSWLLVGNFALYATCYLMTIVMKIRKHNGQYNCLYVIQTPSDPFTGMLPGGLETLGQGRVKMIS